MMKTIDLKAEKRIEFGTSASRNLRLKEKIPAIIYGEKKINETISLNRDNLEKIINDEKLYMRIFNIEINGKKQNAIIKSINRHHYKNKILHIDFQRINFNSIIKIKMPLNFINQKNCIGVNHGGKVNYKIINILIKCKIKDLPENINIDLKNLEIGKNIYLSDINLPKEIKLLSIIKNGNRIVVNVKIPKKIKDELKNEDKNIESKDDNKVENKKL